MKKQWIISKNVDIESKRNSYPERLLVIWKDFPEGYHYIFPSTVIYIMRILKLSAAHNEPIEPFDIYRLHESLKSNISTIHCHFDTDREFFEKKCKMDKEQLDRFLNRLLEASAEYTIHLADLAANYNHLLDSPTVPMEGDLIIADPYHFLTTSLTQNNGTFVLQNSQVTLLGCHFDKTRSYGFGKYDHKQQTVLEEYTVPAARICVGTLDDILRVKPDYDDFETMPYRCIRIKNFKGKVQIQIREVMLRDSERVKKQYQAFVVGKGINVTNAEPINFEMQLPNGEVQ